jgi:hypothetical protein
MIRSAYFHATTGKEPPVTSTSHFSESKEHGPDHIAHCFDYLRQAIMCAADVTLEWGVQVPPGEQPSTINGWGIPHVCKDWDQAVDWTVEHGFKNFSTVKAGNH